jgi:WD40 repeat protein
LISGGEDTYINIIEYDEESNQFTPIYQLDGHISNVKALHIEYLDDNEVILFSGGGNGLLNIWKLLDKTYHLYYSIDISILFQDYSDVNFRIMTICAFRFKNDFVVVLGTSDSTLKIIYYDYENNNLIPWLISDFHNSPVLNLSFISDNIFVSGSTIGKIAFFDLSNELSKFSKDFYIKNIDNIINNEDDDHEIEDKELKKNETKPINEKEKIKFENIKETLSYKSHQSGVNSLNYYKDKNKIKIVSGGDDQSINICEIENNEIKSQIKYENQNSSSIMGIYTNEDYIFSSSIDQRLNIYYKNKFIDSVMFEVLDNSNLDVIEFEKYFLIFIVGDGLQVLKFFKFSF